MYFSSSLSMADGPADPADPYRLNRFVRTHKIHFDAALREIDAGAKRSCWSWYIFPTAPWVVGGVERGSMTNQRYALRDHAPNTHKGDDAARAYLRHDKTDDGVHLRENLLLIVRSVTKQVAEKGIKPLELVGFLDDPKMRSSLKLFERVSRGFDEEVNGACLECLKACKEPPEP